MEQKVFSGRKAIKASPLKVEIAVMKQCRSCGCMNGTVEFVTLGVS